MRQLQHIPGCHAFYDEGERDCISCGDEEGEALDVDCDVVRGLGAEEREEGGEGGGGGGGGGRGGGGGGGRRGGGGEWAEGRGVGGRGGGGEEARGEGELRAEDGPEEAGEHVGERGGWCGRACPGTLRYSLTEIVET